MISSNITIQEIKDIIRNTDRQNLAICYTRNDLATMYAKIYKRKPMRTMDKEFLSCDLWNHIHFVDKVRSKKKE